MKKIDHDKEGHIEEWKLINGKRVLVRTLTLEEAKIEKKRMQEKARETRARNNQYRYRIMQIVRDNGIRECNELIEVLKAGGEDTADLYDRVMKIGSGQAKWYIEDAWKRC